MKTTISTCLIPLLIAGCASTMQLPRGATPPVTICIDNDLPLDEVMRAIRFWGVPTELVPVPSSDDLGSSLAACHVHVSQGAAPPDHPDATGYLVGNHDIVYVGGAPLWYVVRHEFGHFLGYVDSDFGAMSEW